MVIGIIGENCSGKSTLAAHIRDALGAEVVTGKDWLRMAASEPEARRLFRKKLEGAVGGGHIAWVISEPELIDLLPEGAVRILVTCSLDTIKERFRARMRGALPAPVERMLERRHGMFDDMACDLRYDGADGDAAALCRRLRDLSRRPGLPEGDI